MPKGTYSTYLKPPAALGRHFVLILCNNSLPKKNSGYITGGQGVFRVYRNSNYKFYLTVTLSLLVFTCRGKNLDYLVFFTYVFSLFCFIQLFFFQIKLNEKKRMQLKNMIWRGGVAAKFLWCHDLQRNHGQDKQNGRQKWSANLVFQD